MGQSLGAATARGDAWEPEGQAEGDQTKGWEAMKTKDVTPGQSVRLACGCEGTKAVAKGDEPKFWIQRACALHNNVGQFRTLEPDDEVTAI